MTNVEQAVRAIAGGVELLVKVVPGASRSKVAGMLGDRVKLQVAAPPEGGKANAAVCELLAEVLGVTKKAVEVVQGHTQPRKTVRIMGLTREDVIRQLFARQR